MDKEGTSIESKHPYSVFKWKRKQFCQIIHHPSHGLPKMVVNEDLSSLFSAFYHFCESAASSVRSHYCSFATVGGEVSSPSVPLSVVT